MKIANRFQLTLGLLAFGWLMAGGNRYLGLDLQLYRGNGATLIVDNLNVAPIHREPLFRSGRLAIHIAGVIGTQ